MSRILFCWLLPALSLLLLASCGPGDRSAADAVVGRPAPTFTLTDLHGRNWRLADLQGKVVFLNFWASWCQPCLQELPSMIALEQRMPRDSFQILTILHNDHPDIARSLAVKLGLAFPVLVDNNGIAARLYGLTGVPETYIVDAQGILRDKFIGPANWNSPQALAMLEKHLPGPGGAEEPAGGPAQVPAQSR